MTLPEVRDFDTFVDIPHFLIKKSLKCGFYTSLLLLASCAIDNNKLLTQTVLFIKIYINEGIMAKKKNYL